MSKINATTKSVIANIVDNADTFKRRHNDNRTVTFRRGVDEVITFYVWDEFAFIEVEVEHPDSGCWYSAYVETETDGINGAVSAMLAKLVKDSCGSYMPSCPKSLLAWMLNIQ